MGVREEKTDIEGFVVLSLLWFVPVSVPVLDFGCEILISPQNKIHKSTALSMGENGISVGKHE